MKFSGMVGFWEDDVEVSPGIWKPNVVERKYTGDVMRDNRKSQTSENHQYGVFNVNNRIGILGDLYSHEHWPSIRYVVWKGTKWSVSNVEVNYPRLFLDLGGVYNENEETPITPDFM